jgi:23S rRNA (uracil1939-C5)-methyltransferase
VGTFTALLAPHAREVIGIEESASAIADARLNSRGIDNIRYIEAKSEVALDQFSGRIDALVLDPPRRGCHPDVLDAVCRARPRRIALVSCEPDAMARDLARLCDGPFKLVRVQPIDMFPQTRHVEAVASLVLPG